MKMALAYGGIKSDVMASRLGVSRQTLSRWMADKGAPPRRAYLSEWSVATGVPFEWLATGQTPTGPQPTTPKRDEQLMEQWRNRGKPSSRTPGEVTRRYRVPALAAA